MKGKRIFTRTIVVAAILAVGWLVVPIEAGGQRGGNQRDGDHRGGDPRGDDGLSERVLNELTAKFKLPQDVLRELGAILRNEERVLGELANVHIKLDDLKITLGDLQQACLPPDLLPVPPLGGAPVPNNFCAIVDGNLVVRLTNQGRTDAGPSTLRVTFSTPAGPVARDAPTPALAGNGGFIDLQVPVPPECFDPHDPFPSTCNFVIAADVFDDVQIENSEINNIVPGACVPVL